MGKGSGMTNGSGVRNGGTGGHSKDHAYIKHTKKMNKIAKKAKKISESDMTDEDKTASLKLIEKEAELFKQELKRLIKKKQPNK